MATNQYLPFGTAGGANVLSPTDYNSLAARLTGFTAGTAASVQLNTVWRQSSVVSAMIGEFILDYGGFDALDDGSVDNLETGFARTLQKQPWLYATIGGTATALTMALTPAPASWNDLIGVPLRGIISATNTGACTLNVNGLGAKTIVYADGTGVAAGELVAARIAELVYDGTNFVLTNPWTALMRLSPKGAKQTRAFTQNVALADLPSANVNTIVQTITVTGTSYLDCMAYCTFKNENSSFTNMTGWLQVTQAGAVISTGDYLGVANKDSFQTPITIRERFYNLNPALTYVVNLVVKKSSAVGPVVIQDTRILALHE